MSYNVDGLECIDKNNNTNKKKEVMCHKETSSTHREITLTLKVTGHY
jgi:hypothetical protein